MKRLSFLFVCAMFALMPYAFADTFDFSVALRENVRKEISDSAVVRTKSETIAGICKKRIRLLRAMLRSGREQTVAQAINIYMQNSRLHSADFEIAQLRRSENFDQLAHNAKSIIRAYKALCAEAGGGAGDAKKDKADKTAAESTTSRGDFAFSKKKRSGSRPNRQNGTQNGRSYRK